MTPSPSRTTPVSRKRLWAGWILSVLSVVFLLFDSVIKLLAIDPVKGSFAQLGYPLRLVLGIGIVELICVIVYVIPRTAVLGAVLLTGYLGGAIATHVRIESPLVTHTFFPIYVGVLVWGGLFLREDRLRALIPVRTEPATTRDRPGQGGASR